MATCKPEGSRFPVVRRRASGNEVRRLTSDSGGQSLKRLQLGQVLPAVHAFPYNLSARTRPASFSKCSLRSVDGSRSVPMPAVAERQAANGMIHVSPHLLSGFSQVAVSNKLKAARARAAEAELLQQAKQPPISKHTPHLMMLPSSFRATVLLSCHASHEIDPRRR